MNWNQPYLDSSDITEAGQTMSIQRLAALFAKAVATTVLFLIPGLCNALVIYPGQYVDQIPAESGSVSKFVGGVGLFNSGDVPAPAIARSVAEADVPNNKIKLSAWAIGCTPTDRALGLCKIGNYRAAATGRLFVGICIPVDGKTTCDPGDDGPPITATIAFDAARLGYIVTFSPEAKASMSVVADVVDNSVSPARSVGYQEIATESQGSLIGSVKLISYVPVPIPELTNSTATTRRQFVVALRRGHNYQFQLRANVTATGGTGAANVNFRDPLIGIPALNGYFELYNLAIDVSPDTSGGIDPKVIQDLQQRLAELGDRVDAVLAQLTGDEAQNGAELQNLSTQLGQLGAQLQALSAQLDTLNRNQTSLSGSVQTLSNQVNVLTKQVSGLMEHMRNRDRRE